MAKTQAVAVKDDKLPALPDFMQEHVSLGTERLGAGDTEVPRIKLMQALSPELEEYSVKQGQFWHTLAEENLGAEVRISPIFTDTRFILWRPRKSGGGILARADNGINWSPPNGEFAVKLDSGKEVTWRTAPTVAASGLAEWGSSDPSDTGSPPAATRMYVFAVTFPDMPEMPPAVITLQRSAIKVARRFIGKLKITQAPSFGQIYKMTAVKDKNAAGQDFYNFAFTKDGLIEDKDLYESNYGYYKFFKSQGVNVKDLEGTQGDETEVPEDKVAY
jgi:hypothetical protein